MAVGWRWPRNVIRPLAEALSRKSLCVDKNIDAALPMITLHFDGEIETRPLRGGKEIKGRLWWADVGDVVYSKIDVRHGAIGIIPAELGRVCVTGEYPVHVVNEAIADARFIKLLFRTSIFRHRINGMISGASGRKRVQPQDLGELEIPIPALTVQRAIVLAWERGQAGIAGIRRRVSELEDKLEDEFLVELGLAKPQHVTPPKTFAVPWRDLGRWSVSFNQLAGVSVDIRTGKYPVMRLGDIASISYGIQKCPANRPGEHARPYLRVANVQRGELDLHEVKKIDVPDVEMPSFRLEPLDLLVCEGNSADLVGRPAIWRGELLDCVHQNHILRVRVERTRAEPEYVLEYMHTTAARIHFRSRAKFTTNLASINSNDLRDMLLVLPPLVIQRRLIAKVQLRRQHIAALKAEADRRADETEADAEAMILGEKAVLG